MYKYDENPLILDPAHYTYLIYFFSLIFISFKNWVSSKYIVESNSILKILDLKHVSLIVAFF